MIDGKRVQRMERRVTGGTDEERCGDRCARLGAGSTVKGELVVDMPKDAKPATIELHDSPFSGGVTVRLG